MPPANLASELHQRTEVIVTLQVTVTSVLREVAKLVIEIVLTWLVAGWVFPLKQKTNNDFIGMVVENVCNSRFERLRVPALGLQMKSFCMGCGVKSQKALKEFNLIPQISIDVR